MGDNESHSYTPLGTRLGTGFPVVEFKIFNITATSVSWTVEYENLNAEAGDYIKVAHGSREQTFFPQQAVLPVQAEYPDYVGEPYQDQTAREIQVVSTSVDDGEIRGTFFLNFRGKTTVDLSYDSTASEMKSALEALDTIGKVHVMREVEDSAAKTYAWSITF